MTIIQMQVKIFVMAAVLHILAATGTFIGMVVPKRNRGNGIAAIVYGAADT